MTWEIKKPAEHQLNRIRKFFEAEIVGVSAKESVYVETEMRRQASSFLPRNASGAIYPTFWRAAYLPDGSIAGAICAHTPYAMVTQIAAGPLGEEIARGFARARRILACVAVHKDRRGQGLGSALLEAMEESARAEGAAQITGYMDRLNGEPHFYRKNGYIIMPVQKPVPPLEPYPITETHPDPQMFGRWFYKQL